jgi:glycosyltransferase involved in cell wall biosynthesis
MTRSRRARQRARWIFRTDRNIIGAMHSPAAFSVVVPLFDKAPFVRRTIESVLRQTLAPREVIVVDDGSRDGGAAAIADLLGDHVRIVRQDNAGPGAARNRGAAEACGEWIAFLDADDLWLDDHLATLARVIADFPQAHVVAAASHRLPLASADEPGTVARGGTANRRLDFFGDRGQAIVNSSSVAIRRSTFRATAGFGTARAGEDTEYWVRLALDHVFAVSDRVTVIYVRGNGGIMDQEQARMATQAAMPESPMFATLDRALADPRYAPSHGAIRGYADRIRLNYARSLIYHGRGADARRLLAAVSGPRAQVWRTLARVPGPVLRHAAGMYSALKRALAHMPSRSARIAP